jgi:hypothetical protein
MNAAMIASFDCVESSTTSRTAFVLYCKPQVRSSSASYDCQGGGDDEVEEEEEEDDEEAAAEDEDALLSRPMLTRFTFLLLLAWLDSLRAAVTCSSSFAALPAWKSCTGV